MLEVHFKSFGIVTLFNRLKGCVCMDVCVCVCVWLNYLASDICLKHNQIVAIRFGENWNKKLDIFYTYFSSWIY